MRAIYIKNDFPAKLGEYQISGDALHHLVNVVRIKLGETLLLLDGLGTKGISKIIKIDKKSMLVEMSHIETVTRQTNPYSVLLGIPKKDALSDMLKISVELGVHKIYLLRSEFSTENMMTEDRIEKILISSVEQSNNPFMPEVQIFDSLNQIPGTSKQFLLFHLNEETPKKIFNLDEPSKEILLCIGPEGGWSQKEVSWFIERGALVISLPTPIQRAPTALASAVGWYLGHLENLKL